ncbi:delta-lactam-biosynthetic de-N-acetylase [Virgibacillus necropolis]|uniref:Delta-lactam-biosynthetic de-N-acetylase n=1 Tax=Virgibacillus necropolis TaxID=163877 RepID=A0A221MGY1_9BACI|nr:delta-lactam-biosynthetic de-N-acetylase [Virgibacillus necropolis]ASN06894.1 delta-lactam-biosynthetic de-N-acetylase [Virgibacillus necropolis]
MKKINTMIGLFTLSFLIFFSIFPESIAASGYGWGFKKSTNHEIPEIGKYKQLLDKYGAYYVDGSGDKVVYLTFDNGYEQGYTAKVLDILKKEDVPATFFVTGHYVDSKPDLIKRMANEGHIIGNHSYHHPDFSVVSKKTMKKELETLEDAVAEITDQEQMKYLRPPRGIFNEQTLKWANDLGYTHIFWSLAFTDWNTDKQKGANYAYEQVMKQIHPGAIVLLHTVSSDNAEALPRIINDLKEKGYTFKSLDDLILKDMLPTGIY